MRQAKRLILRIGCLISVALCALMLLQVAEVAPPLGLSWGDGVKGRAYDAGFVGGILVRTASGMKQPPAGKYPFGVESLGRLDVLGIHYSRWNMTADRTPVAFVLGEFAEVRISLGWVVLLSLVLACGWVVSVVRERRIVRDGPYCRKCGYDLRATPERCPECGLVPADIVIDGAGFMMNGYMAWEPYREPLRVTLLRTGVIALVVGALVARVWSGGGAARWPVASLLMLWPALGGHCVEVGFLNFVRPRLSGGRGVQVGTRVLVWFLGGSLLALGMGLTAMGLGIRWGGWGFMWWVGGVGFVAIELVVHLVLYLRGKPSFYDGRR
jgi:hypothetical protein